MTGYIQEMRKLVGHRTIIQCAASVICVDELGRALLGKRTDNHLWGYSGGSAEIDFSGGPVAVAPAAQGGNAAMARAALQELGYSAAEVQSALKGADPNASTEELIRHALRQMVMKG